MRGSLPNKGGKIRLKKKGLRLLWGSQGTSDSWSDTLWGTPYVACDAVGGVGGWRRWYTLGVGGAVLSMPHEAEGVRPSFFRRWRSVDAGKPRIAAAAPGPAIRPFV